ncbi:MAG: cobalamin biosynthesis protein CbiX [Verrucomicrobia bacterium]|nr:cobalamin biosynthesis protein CbiX [Verrucomicrobiota bacterium]
MMNLSQFKNAALVIAGHGSTRNPDSCVPTLEHAENIRRRGIFAEVATCFWKQEPSFREALRMVESPEIYVVPNFISEGYFTRTVIPREMELDGRVTVRGGRTIKYCEPAGRHPLMTELLVKEARSVAPDVPPAETSLLIVGHGTGLDSNSAEAARFQAGVIASAGEYGEVMAAFMEEAPLIGEWDRLASRPNVVVVPFFISDGLHSYQDIPVLLGIRSGKGKPASQSEIFRHNPHDLRGRRLYYGAAIGTEPDFAEIILDQVRAFPELPE